MERFKVSTPAALEPNLDPGRKLDLGKTEAYSSGVSWAPVFAGAFVTAALSLILLALGAGIGLSSVSPWSTGMRAATMVGYIAIIWLVLTQIIAAGVGGYLAGRLRTKWVSIHTDEVHFRDTAHGFLVWAVSLVLIVGVLGSSAVSMAGGAGAAATNAVTASEEVRLDPNQYWVDMLFRSTQASAEQNTNTVRAEVGSIVAHSLRQGELTPADRTYLADVVSRKTSLSQSEADKRVGDVLEQARQSMESARKIAAHSLYWTFLAMLVGAFCASFAATVGGRQRDHVVVV